MAKHQEDTLYVTNPTDEPFTDVYGRIPRTLQPGQQILWPRYIAEHFAKHLADKILLRMEKQEELDAKAAGLEYKPRSLQQSAKLRPQVVDSILIGVYQFFDPGTDSEQARVQAQIDAMNAPAESKRAMDIGQDEVDPVMGKLSKVKDEDKKALPNPPVPTTQTPPSVIPLPPGAGNQQMASQATTQPAQGIQTPPAAQTTTQQQTASTQPQESNVDRLDRLRGEADTLGIEYPRSANGNQLEKMIREFAGAQ